MFPSGCLATEERKGSGGVGIKKGKAAIHWREEVLQRKDMINVKGIHYESTVLETLS